MSSHPIEIYSGGSSGQEGSSSASTPGRSDGMGYPRRSASRAVNVARRICHRGYPSSLGTTSLVIENFIRRVYTKYFSPVADHQCQVDAEYMAVRVPISFTEYPERQAIVSLVSLGLGDVECSICLSQFSYSGQNRRTVEPQIYNGDLTACKGPTFQFIGCFTPSRY